MLNFLDTFNVGVTHFVQPSSKRKNVSVSFNMPDLNSDLHCVGNHQANDNMPNALLF